MIYLMASFCYHVMYYVIILSAPSTFTQSSQLYTESGERYFYNTSKLTNDRSMRENNTRLPIVLEFNLQNFTNTSQKHITKIEGHVDQNEISSYEEEFSVSLQTGDMNVLRYRTRRAATAVKERLWPNATIPYHLGTTVSDKVKKDIFLAMDHWMSFTCIKFIKRTNEKDYIVFGPGACGCCSYVGRLGTGAQEVTLSDRCANYGVIVHELGHVVGFWHDHSRPDRDSYVEILDDNVLHKKKENFEKKTALEIESLGEKYDYRSIMHYRKKTFSKNGKETMKPIKPRASIGQRKQLSEGDIIQTRLLYNCPKPNCLIEMDSLEGSIQSPNYPDDYFRNYECTWIIKVVQGEMLKLQFIDFSLERSVNCSTDYVEIGDVREGSVIGRMCGEGVPGTFYLSSSTSLKFVSDLSDTFRGFWAQYSKIKAVDESYDTNLDQENYDDNDLYSDSRADRPLNTITYAANCNREYEKREGSISSPLMPILYSGTPLECSWSIDGGPNASYIEISVETKFNQIYRQKCLGEIFKVYKTESADVEPQAFHYSNSLLEKPINDGDRYEEVEYDCFSTPVLLIAVSSLFIHWSSDVHQPISFSYVIDYDECSLETANCEHSCQNSVDGYSCLCHLGYKLSSNGRTCKAKIPAVANKCTSNSILTSERGIISGSNPASLDNCQWYINPPTGMRVLLIFQKFRIPSSKDCNANYLEIKVGSNHTSRSRYCGTRVPGPLSPPAGPVVVTLRSLLHRALVSLQFSAKYIVYRISRDLCYFNIRVRSRTSITSPFHPNAYPANVICTWRVSARRGSNLAVSFSDLDIERTKSCQFDYVEVRKGHKMSQSILLARYCGYAPPAQPLLTGSNQLMIMFVSDSSGSSRGFSADIYQQTKSLPNNTTIEQLQH